MNNKIKLIIIVFIILLIVFGIFILNKKDKNTNRNEINNNKLEENSKVENIKLKIQVNDYELIATLNNNSSVDALIEKLKDGLITIEMDDYANMEKVGPLGFDLPRNDENISTDFGDLILYQGTSFVIYYDTNNWNFTKLGKIDNISKSELKEILGSGKVTVTLSLQSN